MAQNMAEAFELYPHWHRSARQESNIRRLTFDTALLSQPAAFHAEVIVHEPLYLKVLNHGRLFKALLRV